MIVCVKPTAVVLTDIEAQVGTQHFFFNKHNQRGVQRVMRLQQKPVVSLACRHTVTQSVRGRASDGGGEEQAKDNKLEQSVDLKKQKDEPLSPPR